uniref:peptidylprolyl isomerase n=2 Tax=Flavobacterium sp. TaxID=239 RepID=UPI004049B367
MMRLKSFVFGFLLFVCANVFAQNPEKIVLFTIDDTPYFSDEFVRVYNKNLDLVKDESQKDLDNYLELFIGYKLKITKAMQMGLQNDRKYQNELRTYRNQLSKNYLTDKNITDELIQEGYERSLKEIRASHILFLLDENALPADTLKVYNKLLDLRTKILKEGNFGDFAAKFSEDPSAKQNKGDLGYFSAFRMVYPFESAAFETPKGEISMPVRTRFGYHLINVTDIRDNRGELTVAHIMLSNPKEGEEATVKDIKGSIDEIAAKLKQGESFEALAKQFSQDRATANKGGVLNRFGAGQLSAASFENAAFALTAENPISEPVQTDYGWHIIKLIEKHPLKSFEEAKKEIERNIEKDDRSRLIQESMTDKLKVKYRIIENKNLLAKIAKSVDKTYFEGKWEPNSKNDFSKTLFTIQDDVFSGDQFVEMLKEEQKARYPEQPITAMVEKIYTKILNEQVNKYYEAHLEDEFPEFAAVMQEYRDGLLLFELMEQEIWKKSKNDTLGYTQYHQDHIQNYQWQDRYEVLIVSSKDQKKLKKALKLFKKEMPIADVKSKINEGDQVYISSQTGLFEADNTALPTKMPKEVGVSSIFEEEGYFYFVDVKNIMPAGPKKIEECRGKVINDYQQYLESTWISKLKSEFDVKVNRTIFEAVKQSIKS